MNKTIRRSLPVILILLLFTVVIPARARAEGEKHFLWQAKTQTATVYLLGSVHFMKRDAYPLSPVIEKAFAGSDTIAVEANINDIGQETLAKLRAEGFYTGNDSIANHVSRETYTYITAEAARLGFPVASLDRQRPWFLAMTMSSIELMKAGYNPHYGIDKYFLTRAAGRKKLVELETIDYQIDLLARLPDKEQESFLLYALKDLSSLVQQVDRLMAAWTTGDSDLIAELLEKSVGEDESLKVIHRKILTERNRNMAKKIALHLGSSGCVFVVVGAAHLVGDKGIVELLRKEGFTVEQL
ncbi:MAG TPA: TraB/GumN family protein [Syntrophorhabdaceae bacterium]|nr:TraB/GumN family protein [Syntrophorhabdaceae bacterium]